MAVSNKTADAASAEPEKLNSRTQLRMTLSLFQTLRIARILFLQC